MKPTVVAQGAAYRRQGLDRQVMDREMVVAITSGG
jgi:hypothetical protein